MIRQTTLSPVVRKGRRLGVLPWFRAAILGATLAVSILSPSSARAAEVDDDRDARLEGYKEKPVAIEKTSTTPTFLMYMFLVLVGCVPLFKTAKRE